MNVQRFKNYGLWVSLASAILLILQQLGYGIDVGKYNEIVFAILNLLVILGILNDNNTNSKWYGDDK